ncbi:uncharacterized protein HRG_08848 [Hirsutella rhossiliensis]|uniref:Uncharacterized protein n=1 Tax=Hirsutella rhossiliensis TaxID=111463 RepID=A0A9P8MRN6_9HYPO|nr:uncharacterized protein HRG_08848 [Hirsutella rhossiliensis]KAH0959827.1 hypothetical protein HRG_08848 [Hirsutella rhossiliensis]
MAQSSDHESSSKVIILNGPCDWKQWISVIQKFATSHNIWEFVDPANDDKSTIVRPSEPTHIQVNAQASDLGALTSEEFRRLEYLHTSYRSRLQTYRDNTKALASLQEHIVKHIGNYYSTIADEHDVAKQLSLLQARVAPTDWALEREVLERYRAVLRAPDRSEIETWVTKWQKTLTEAKKLGLPDTQGLRPTQDFLQAVSSINEPFTDYWINKMEDEAVTGKPDWKDHFPDGIKISEIFERAHRIKNAGSKGNNDKGGAFPVGFQGRDKDGKQKPTSDDEKKENRCKIRDKLESNIDLKRKVDTILDRTGTLLESDKKEEPLKGGLFQLNNVAYIPNFHTNVASLDLFIQRDTIGILLQESQQKPAFGTSD